MQFFRGQHGVAKSWLHAVNGHSKSGEISFGLWRGADFANVNF